MKPVDSPRAVVAIAALSFIAMALWMPLATCESAEPLPVGQLIDQLASGNPLPEIVGQRSKKAIYPPNYDREAEKRVMSARDALVERGVAAFPELIRHIDDGLYSYTRRGYPEHFTVGEVCHSIMAVQVEVYRGFTDLEPGRSGPTFVPVGKRQVEEWWKQRRDRTLRELQLEGVNLALDAVKKQPDDGPQSKKDQIAGLERLLKRLQSTKDPIRVNSDGRFVSDKELGLFPGSDGLFPK